REDIFVYAPPGQELDDFLALIEAFNRRADRPTAWRPIVRAGTDSFARLAAGRPGDIAILAGRNDREVGLMRPGHEAGLHALAAKRWLAGSDGFDDLRHVLAGRPLAVEIMTGRHEIPSILARKLVAEAEVFGAFAPSEAGPPAIEMASTHHLEKMVNG